MKKLLLLLLALYGAAVWWHARKLVAAWRFAGVQTLGYPDALRVMLNPTNWNQV